MQAEATALPRRRRYPRDRVTILLTLSYRGSVDEATTIDISEIGVLVETLLRPPIGSIVDLELYLDGRDAPNPIGIRAEVIDHRNRGNANLADALGLRFVSIQPDDRRALRSYLEANRYPAI